MMTEPLVIIPARGGSKGFPGKNLAPLLGVPLLVHSIWDAFEAGFSWVVISTDDKDIVYAAIDAKAAVQMRPPKYATDDAPSELALRHAVERLGPVDTVVFLQCTSPLRDPAALQKAYNFVADGYECESAFSAYPLYPYIWIRGRPQYNPYRRKMRQHRAGVPHVETGSFYVFRSYLLDHDPPSRFGSGIARPVLVDNMLEIDTPEDLELAEWHMKRKFPNGRKRPARP